MCDDGGSKTPGQHLGQHLREAPRDQATADQAADRDQEGFAEGQSSQLGASSPQHRHDREAAAPFGEPDREDNAAGAGCQQDCEY